MNLQAEKLEIMKLILETDNPGILESIKGLFKRTKPVDYWDSLPQEQKDDINLGIKETDNRDVVTYDDFISKHR